MQKHSKTIQTPTGKLGILIPGMGAVTTTLLAGIELIRQNKMPSFGSVSQTGHIRLGKRSEMRQPRIRDVVPLAALDDLAFCCWDIFPDNAYDAARHANVLTPEQLLSVKNFLSKITPLPGLFDRKFVKKLDGRHIKKGRTWWDKHLELQNDIDNFSRKSRVSRRIMVWCASTEIFLEPSKTHATLSAFEKGLRENAASISPSMVYAYTAIKNKIPFINGAPNLSCNIPALTELAHKNGVPIAGKDFKTGQTLLKTIIAPGLKARMLGIDGWFSTNILGNRDGEVLDDPESFRSKETSKLSVLRTILQPDLYPELYEHMNHMVRINYYPPRGDRKESWDNIDLFGWLGRKMQIKINFLCEDSILAAPVVLDLILFMDLAQRAGLKGIQEWLSFYFKSPLTDPSAYPEHDLFIQQTKMKNTLRHLMGEKPVTHMDLE